MTAGGLQLSSFACEPTLLSMLLMLFVVVQFI